MATITRSLSSKVNGNGESEIMLRLTVSRELRLRLRSGVFIEPSRFRDGKFYHAACRPQDACKITNYK